MGIVSLQEALDAAAEGGYDLAEIAPSATPPVVKIIDWGKFKYEQGKQLAKAKKNQRQVEVKTVKLGLKIGQHDLEVKVKRARKFLEEGDKVKVSMLFRGREITHPDLGHALLARFMSMIEDIAVQEQTPVLSGRDLNMILGLRKDAKAQDTQRDGEAD
jgi:translation initiation factor IF-3